MNNLAINIIGFILAFGILYFHVMNAKEKGKGFISYIGMFWAKDPSVEWWMPLILFVLTLLLFFGPIIILIVFPIITWLTQPIDDSFIMEKVMYWVSFGIGLIVGVIVLVKVIEDIVIKGPDKEMIECDVCKHMQPKISLFSFNYYGCRICNLIICRECFKKYQRKIDESKGDGSYIPGVSISYGACPNGCRVGLSAYR